MAAVSVTRQQEPDLILLDIGLPGGTGLTVMERLKNFPALAHIPVIAVSARDPAATGQAARAAGARAFLEKPIDYEALVAAIRDALESG